MGHFRLPKSKSKIEIEITAMKYIFNNLWDKIDVCLVFKGNQEGRMIDLSTQGIFYFVMVSPVLCENGLKYAAVSEMSRAIFTAW